MKKKHIVVLIIVILAVAGLYAGWEWFQVNPFSSYELSDLIYASRDVNGNLLVLEDSGGRLLKIDPSGTLLWKREVFDGAKRVVSDEEGTIYVHDVQIEQGVRISSESVLSFDQNGEQIEEAVCFTYDEKVMSPRIVGLVPDHEGFYYFVKQENGFSRNHFPEEEERFYPLVEAGTYLFSVTYDPASDSVYYSTYDGKVCRYEEDGESTILFDSDDSEELSVPAEVTCAENGLVYVADIGVRDILQIDPADGSYFYLPEEGERFEKEIAYNVNASHGFTACTNYSVKLWDGEEYTYVTTAMPANEWRVIIILFWLSALALAVLLLTSLILFIKYVLTKAQVFTKIVVGMVAFVTVVGAIFVGIMLPQFQSQYIDSIFSRAQLAAAVTEERIPYEAFERLNSASDYMKEDYLAVKDSVESIFLMEDDSIQDFYCTMYSVKDDDMIVRSYTLENIGAIYPYDWEYEGSEEQKVLTSLEGNTYIYQATEGSYLFVLNPIINDDGKAVGLIEVGTDLDSVMQESFRIIRELFITVLAMTVTVILLVMELIYYGQGRSEYNKEILSNFDNHRIAVPSEILRMIVFLIFFLTNLATSFLPVYAMRISDNSLTFGLPAEVLAAIPISAEVLSGAIFSITGGSICERLGNRKAVTLSAVMLTIGFGLRVVPDIWVLTFGNFLLGLGWGIILLIVNTDIAMMPSKKKDAGFSNYNAAALNGINCGVVFGGFLMQWISYQVLFIMTAVLSLLVLVMARKYLSSDTFVEEEEQAGSISTMRFVFHPSVFGYFIMVVVPIIACGYFLNYMYPIIGAEWGLSETNIGYSYLLNGLCVMALSGTLTQLFHKRKRGGLILSALIYVGAFLLVAQLQSIPALFVALVLLGIADSFGLPLQTSFYTDSKIVQKYGFDRAMGVYSLFENGAQAAGSFVFSYVLLIGVRQGLTLVLTVILILTAIFAIVGIFGRRRKTAADVDGETDDVISLGSGTADVISLGSGTADVVSLDGETNDVISLDDENDTLPGSNHKGISEDDGKTKPDDSGNDTDSGDGLMGNIEDRKDMVDGEDETVPDGGDLQISGTTVTIPEDDAAAPDDGEVATILEDDAAASDDDDTVTILADLTATRDDQEPVTALEREADPVDETVTFIEDSTEIRDDAPDTSDDAPHSPVNMRNAVERRSGGAGSNNALQVTPFVIAGLAVFGGLIFLSRKKKKKS